MIKMKNVFDEFKYWKESDYAHEWLEGFGYTFNDINNVSVTLQTKRRKSDLVLRIDIHS